MVAVKIYSPECHYPDEPYCEDVTVIFDEFDDERVRMAALDRFAASTHQEKEHEKVTDLVDWKSYEESFSDDLVDAFPRGGEHVWDAAEREYYSYDSLAQALSTLAYAQPHFATALIAEVDKLKAKLEAEKQQERDHEIGRIAFKNLRPLILEKEV